MPQVPIIMPQLGESIAEATIVDIKVKPGEEVAADQEIIEVETNKAVMGVTTPCKGKIGNITAQVKETYPIGAVLGYVEASEADAARFTKTGPALYAVRALALALAQNPAVAAKLIGGRVVTSDSIDIGVAVEAEDGIMVPVIRAADKTSLADLTTKYAELV